MTDDLIRFRTLGAPDLLVTQDGRRLLSVLAQPKRVLLLAHLVCEGRRGPVPRDALLPLFWPDSPEERARNALNQALHVLRRALGADVIVSGEGNTVWVDRGRVECDAVVMEERLDRGQMTTALELYHGDFLEGMEASGPLERWVEAERRRLALRAARAAAELVESRLSEGNLLDAVHWARRAVDWLPDDETALRRLMTLLARSGDRQGALRVYAAFVERLARDYGDEPLEETRRLAESIRDRPEERARAAPAGESSPTAASIPVGRSPAEPRGRDGAGRWRRLVLAPAAILVLALLGWLQSETHEASGSPSEVSARRVLVAPLTAGSADPELEDLGRMAADWIAAGLAGTGLVQVVGPSEVVRSSGLAASSGSASAGTADLAPEVFARDVAARVGAGVLVTGEIFERGDSLLWAAKIVDAPSGRLVHVLHLQGSRGGAPRDDVVRLRDAVAAALAIQLDDRTAAWAGEATPPPGLEEYRHFADGIDLFHAGRFEAAAERFAAAARDPSFASAVLWGAWAHLRDFFATGAIHEGKRARADSLLRLLDPARARLTPLEVALLDHHVATSRFDYATAHEAISRATRLTYDLSWLLRQVELATLLDRPHEVLRVLESLDPSPQWLGDHEARYWGMRARALHRLGRYGQELEIAERRLIADPGDGAAGRMRLRALAGLGEDAAVEAWLRLHPDKRHVVGELRVHGYGHLARQIIEANLAEDERIAHEQRDDEWSYRRGLALAGLDRLEEARVELERVGERSPRYLDALAELGWVVARLGDAEEAIAISHELERIEEVAWRLTNQARIAAALGEREAAVGLLRQMPIQGYLHPEMDFEPLRGYPPYEELLQPRG